MGLASYIVHKSGGIIDRSLGDGLLCFFGYQYELNATSSTTHAEQAMNCAATIQAEILKRDFLAMNLGGTIFPLRIGINTGEVYAGDLGGGHKIDFTIIGHSVNFAQRLESACENYRVMCGPATHDSLELNSSLKRSLTRKYIAIKHHAELVEAYEFDPFFQDAEAQTSQKTLCRKLDKSSRIDVRWPVNPNLEIKIKGSFGEGLVINFSQSGLEIKSKTYIGKGAHINFVFSTPDNKLADHLKSGGIIEATAEVRWSWNQDGAFRLGLKFKNQSREQQAVILQCLRTSQA